MCTFDNTCTASGTDIRVDQDNNNYFESGCDESGDICDDGGGTSFTQTGLCAANDCDAQDVVNNSGTFLADCNDGGGMECEADASSGSFAQSGMCFDDGGNSDGTNFDCEVAGIIIFNATRYIDDTQNNTDTYDYDSDNDGRSCDSTITSGGNYSATGMMTTNGCTAATGLVSANGSNNNYFVVGCTGDGGDMCDTATAVSLDSPFTQDGICLADKSCDGSDVVNHTNAYYTSCDGYGGVQSSTARPLATSSGTPRTLRMIMMSQQQIMITTRTTLVTAVTTYWVRAATTPQLVWSLMPAAQLQPARSMSTRATTTTLAKLVTQAATFVTTASRLASMIRGRSSACAQPTPVMRRMS